MILKVHFFPFYSGEYVDHTSVWIQPIRIESDGVFWHVGQCDLAIRPENICETSALLIRLDMQHRAVSLCNTNRKCMYGIRFILQSLMQTSIVLSSHHFSKVVEAIPYQQHTLERHQWCWHGVEAKILYSFLSTPPCPMLNLNKIWCSLPPPAWYIDAALVRGDPLNNHNTRQP